MANFNLEDYETVKERKAKFYEQFKEGSIVVELQNYESVTEFALFKASVYESKADQLNGTPRGVGYALELRDKEKRLSGAGKEYESVNFTSWTENAEESAIGRALDNAGFSGNKKPSREEMSKVQRHSEILNKPTGTITREPVVDDTLIHGCNVHKNDDGSRVVMTLVAKNGNYYHKVNGVACFGKGVIERK